ncbi:hypothetical protein JI666_00805 [Bacillus sp. NTK071]|uniref:hypothetical protein n=1 Tax=Bacillus sp. NTK071 TaxID=2802175 RepID=UPI001A8D8ADF|nr:hypothetical protein [Bacillus sp. NTK071]MBN8207279.1 hypothetical protein [Bacillus sp. NTK071]
MALVMLILLVMFLGLALFMNVIWNGIKTDSAAYDREFLWMDYEEIMKKEDIF